MEGIQVDGVPVRSVQQDLEYAAQATPDQVEKVISGLYDRFARSHAELTGEALLSTFMNAVKSGMTLAILYSKQ